MTATVRTRPVAGQSSGNRQGWIKHVTEVNDRKNDGYAFIGSFLDSGKQYELPVGAVILHVDPAGSVKNSWQAARVAVLQADGSEQPVHESPFDWRQDFLSVRDTVSDALGADHSSALEEFTDDQIMVEARLRGLIA